MYVVARCVSRLAHLVPFSPLYFSSCLFQFPSPRCPSTFSAPLFIFLVFAISPSRRNSFVVSFLLSSLLFSLRDTVSFWQCSLALILLAFLSFLFFFVVVVVVVFFFSTIYCRLTSSHLIPFLSSLDSFAYASPKFLLLARSFPRSSGARKFAIECFTLSSFHYPRRRNEKSKRERRVSGREILMRKQPLHEPVFLRNQPAAPMCSKTVY